MGTEDAKTMMGQALSLQELALSLRKRQDMGRRDTSSLPPVSSEARQSPSALDTRGEGPRALGVTEIVPDFWG